MVRKKFQGPACRGHCRCGLFRRVTRDGRETRHFEAVDPACTWCRLFRSTDDATVSEGCTESRHYTMDDPEDLVWNQLGTCPSDKATHRMGNDDDLLANVFPVGPELDNLEHPVLEPLG